MKTQYHPVSGSHRKILLTLICISLLAASALAQVPGMISYQGRILVNNTNFNGVGQFKFAIVDDDGEGNYWSNDGTSVNGSQPTTAVSLNVANGLVMTLLGNAALPNMTLIPATVFNGGDRRLRVWFNGGLGFEQLAPDQRFVSVPYAMMAGTVPNGSITTTKLAPGVLSATNLTPNSVGSAQLADVVALGASNSINGRLDIYGTPAGTPAISLAGINSQITTYGSSGLEKSRLGGMNLGELLLQDGSGNDTTVELSAQDKPIMGSPSRPGGNLHLRSGNGSDRVSLEGSGIGGQMSLYQNDGNIGMRLDGDDGGAGAISVRGTNGSTRVFIDGSSGSGGGEVSVHDRDGTETVQLLAGNTGGSLNLNSDAGHVAVILSGSSSGGALSLFDGDGSFNIPVNLSAASGVGNIKLRQADNSQGVVLTADNGTLGGAVSVYQDNGTLGGQLTSGFLSLANSAGQERFYASVGGTGGAALYLHDSAGVPTIILNSDFGNEGRITTQVLEFTGGSDLSEQFDIKVAHDELKAGMIVCIDPDQPGQLLTSAKAYDRTVAGIVSGAGGIKPGMLMGQQGTAADGRHPVALTGRVYCWVDASKGAVRPGDLITTSETPGHGMRVKDHKKAQGAVIGKAMSPLEKGQGLVLVLVSLQ